MAELVACPDCKKHLQVPDELIGKKVQCPECKHTFTADVAQPEEAGIKSSSSAARSSASRSSLEKTGNGDSRKKKKRRDDDDDEYEDDDDRPRRRSSIRRLDYVPHRGSMILTFGITGMLCLPFVFGPIAWIMGNSDLREIREGRMDPEGEGMTQAGRILGMVATIMAILGVLAVCGYFVFVFLVVGLMIGAAGANKGFGPPPRKF